MAAQLDQQLKRYKQNLRLYFDNKWERGYGDFYQQQHFNHHRICIYASLLIYTCTTGLDWVLLGTDFVAVTQSRFSVLMLLLLITWLTLKRQAFTNNTQTGLTIIISIMACSTLLFINIDHAAVSQIYFNGMLLTLVAGLIAVRLQFSFALIISATVFIAYLGYLKLATDTALALIIANIYLLSGIIFLGLLSNYMQERSLRLSYLKHQIIVQNRKKLRRINRQLSQANQRLGNLAATDPLTGIENRRSFEQTLNTEYLRAYRDQKPISLIMTDIDLFKKYNDHYGHQQGDACLQQVAKVLSKFAQRAGDCLARYGGEEFVLVLPNTDAMAANKIAHALVAAVQQQHIEHARSSVAEEVTISAGVATVVPKHQDQATQLVCEADKHLYRAKAHGRNCYKSASACLTLATELP